MTFSIITHVEHSIDEGKFYAYGPYVREMNLWAKHVNKIVLVSPRTKLAPGTIDLPYQHSNIKHLPIPSISLTSFTEAIKAIFALPVIVFQIFRGMYLSNHIHLRCPGNIGLIGCYVQVLFPKKPKTAKYAGNWDPAAKQPKSYRLQKRLLSSTFWTKNMQALVYGNWPGQSKNIKSFFTATYRDNERIEHVERSHEGLSRFVFVGGLTTGKRPLYAAQLVHELKLEGVNCRLEFYGEGVERDNIEDFIATHNISEQIILKGNQTAATVQQAYLNSDFMILPSKSEGWPKAVAEAMFWGCIPIATKISCVPWMLDFGKRGLLLEMNLQSDVAKIKELIEDSEQRKLMSEKAKSWSQQYTLDKFEAEIVKLLK
ncbi:MAG: glycosyltransferase family 4 protein [Flavobacteriaceae bacterium]|nr:glycosyltransferase family 4 protein [Flavobacteriaceae bacterium]